MFASAGVSYPIGREQLRSLDDLLNALGELRDQKPGLTRAIVKLNDAVSGEGNAVVDLPNCPLAVAAEAAALLEQRVRSKELPGKLPTSATFERFRSLAEHGGIVEECIRGIGFCSPSVQMRITPLGEVEVLSTHDQILGGPSGQSFWEPLSAHRGYGPLITAEGRKVGHRLAKLGVLPLRGRFRCRSG